jgi:hypothetical protein
MQKVTVEFEGADGTPITQTHYFNLSETDFSDILAEQPEFFKPSRLKEFAVRSAAATDQETKVAVQAEMAYFIKDVILHAHGTRVGQEFFHLPDETLKFKRGLACNAVLKKVLDSEETLITFLTNVLPESMRASFSVGTVQSDPKP